MRGREGGRAARTCRTAAAPAEPAGLWRPTKRTSDDGVFRKLWSLKWRRPSTSSTRSAPSSTSSGAHWPGGYPQPLRTQHATHSLPGKGGMHHTINTADAACTLRRALCPSEAVRCAPVFRTRERARQSQARPRRSNLKRTQTLAGGRAEGRVLEYSRRVLEYSRRAGGRAGGAPAAVLVA